MNLRLAFLILGLCCVGCKSKIALPENRIPQYQIDYNSSRSGDTLHLVIKPNNPSPTKNWVRVHDEPVLETMILPLQSLDTSIVVGSSEWTLEDVVFSSTFGGVQKIDSVTMYLPWPKGLRYKVIQGYNGGFSHQSEFSRYALDFNLGIGDTVTAAQNGVVVGVVDGYSQGGNDRRLRDYANFITLYHPDFGVYTQYVHLKESGSLVSVGDQVTVNQPIGLSGNVGFTSTPHLHFNILGQTENGDLESIPAYFGPEHSGSMMQRGWIVHRSKD